MTQPDLTLLSGLKSAWATLIDDAPALPATPTPAPGSDESDPDAMRTVIGDVPKPQDVGLWKTEKDITYDLDIDTEATVPPGSDEFDAIQTMSQAAQRSGASQPQTELDNLPPVAAIIGRLLAKEPGDRYQDAYDVIDALCQAAGIPVPEESAAIRESFLQAAAFVGRQSELVQLEEALNEALRDAGSAWLVGGESGTGKTRLLDELRTRALVRGMLVLRGQGVAEGGMTYQLWRDVLPRLILNSDVGDTDAGILADLVPDIGALLEREIPPAVAVEGTSYRQRLQDAIISLFRRQQQPILLLLEDLQWASESLDMLKLLNGTIADLPMLIVGNYRYEERPDLPDELPGMKTLKLDRLDRESVAALSVSMLGEAGRQPDVLDLLHRETEGNVYFLVEVVRALAEEAGRLHLVGRIELPQYVSAGGIQTVIERRLARIPDSGQRLLRLTAVAGRELDLDVLKQLSGEVNLDDWLVTCSNSAVLEVSDGEWRFAHDKLRQATLQAINPKELPGLHQDVAKAIEAAYPDALEHASVLAQHWRGAGNTEKERYYALEAGVQALLLSAFDDAVAYLERALALYPKSDTDVSTRAYILLRLGEAYQFTGEFPTATEKLETSLDLYRDLDDYSGAARALNWLASVAQAQGNYAEAIALAQESLRLVSQTDNKLGEGRALHRLGGIAYDRGEYDSAQEYFENSLVIARDLSDRYGLDQVLTGLGMVAFAQGNYDSATRYFEDNLEVVRVSGERYRMGVALQNLGSVAGSREDFTEASRYFEQSLRIFREIGARQKLVVVLDNLGVLAELLGDFDDATQYYEESLALSEAIGNRPAAALTLCNLGNVATAQEEKIRAAELYNRALRTAREIEATPIIMDVLVGLAGINPDTDEALAWLGLVFEHPATIEGTRQVAAPIVDDLKEKLGEDTVEAGMAAGAELDLDEVVAKILSRSDA
jgi:tetratricopeptide (TPR) repeat protein